MLPPYSLAERARELRHRSAMLHLRAQRLLTRSTVLLARSRQQRARFSCLMWL